MASIGTLLPFIYVFFFFISPSWGKVLDNNPIKHLQGCHKGDKVQGLYKLKLYLAKYGYLNYQHSPDDHTNADAFDEELDAALKSYQNFYHLNATGVLDENTVSQMLVPRCGHPDKIIHQHGTNTLHTVSHYAFFPNKDKWPPSKSRLTYAFDSAYPRRYVPPVVRAFNTWATSSKYFTFTRVRNIQGADLKISFKRPVHDDKNFELNHLAHAQAPPGGLFHYNTAFKWSVGPRPVRNRFDLKTVALHEIGHLLGLEHSQDPNAIMFANIPPGAVKGLNFDDIQGIKVLYGIN
uniref:metalloendoproteinase 3-MMP-like n=1 Tax=Erigeron canadensis TaxID=72917 RepID=UPI001CB8A23D|nr:metalloendoproteinase 3-MMP-like [Erigeron canadensis]